jgi:hypothetical protein
MNLCRAQRLDKAVAPGCCHWQQSVVFGSLTHSCAQAKAQIEDLRKQLDARGDAHASS